MIDDGQVKNADEKHFRLVPADQISSEDLTAYSRRPTVPGVGSMHDMAKESYIFWLLMPDRNLRESALAANLIRKGLTADEVIDVIEKRRDANAR